MPELPEVETIKKELEEKIVNKKIANVLIEDSFAKKISPKVGVFIKKIIGKIIKKVSRRGKLLYFKLGEDSYLLIHLKMTGQLVYEPKRGKYVVGGHPIEGVEKVPNKFTRVELEFSDGTALYFNDVRKFGYFKLVDGKRLEKELSKFGHEPTDDDWNFEYFKQLFKNRPKIKIKQLLLDQGKIAGLGNIYVDEACFKAGVRPDKVASKLTLEQKKALFVRVREVLFKAIKAKGTSFSNYVNSEGRKGGYQKYLMVYGRGGEICKKCRQARIKKIKLGGRGTTYCPICQK